MPGYYDNASPPEPDPHPCEGCVFWDWVKEVCIDGHEPESCPHLKHVMSDDWKYQRGVDEGEIR